MELTDEEQAMLDGAQGPAVQEAIAYLIKVGEFWGARRFVPVTNVHMMGDIEVMGDGGLASARMHSRAQGPLRGPRHDQRALLRLRPTSTSLGQDAGEAVKERKLIALPPADGRHHHRHLHQLPDRSTSRTSASTWPGATPAR